MNLYATFTIEVSAASIQNVTRVVVRRESMGVGVEWTA